MLLSEAICCSLNLWSDLARIGATVATVAAETTDKMITAAITSNNENALLQGLRFMTVLDDG